MKYSSVHWKHAISTLVLAVTFCTVLPLAVQAADVNPLASESPSRAPLQGHLVQHALGVRSLPAGMTPDFIIGHFALGIGFIHIMVNGPFGNTAQLTSEVEKMWHGKQVHFCELLLHKIPDGSGGYYFTSIGHSDGPHGWLMPMPKSAKDHVTPWAIYYDQPDAPGNVNDQ